MAIFEARLNLTSQQYQQVFDQFVSQGLRPASISGYSAGGPPYFAAVFAQGSGYPFQAFNDLTTAGYQQTYDTLVNQGFRPTVISGYDGGGQPYFAALFEQVSGYPFQAFHNMTALEYQQTSDTLVNRGFQPTFVNGYTVAGQPLFAAIFEQVPGPPVESFHNLTSVEYQQTFDAISSRGYQPRVVSGYDGGGQPLFAAIFQPARGNPFQSFNNMSIDDAEQTFDTMARQGFQPTVVSGYAVNGQPWFAAIFEQ